MLASRELYVAAIALCLAALARIGAPEVCRDGRCPSELVGRMPIAAELPDSVRTGIALDLPPALRTKNWGGGSCVHASNVNLLKKMDLGELAEWWRKTYSGGEYDTRLVSRLEAAGLRYAYINDARGNDADGDGVTNGEEFLNYCIRTGRGAGIFYKPQHSINCSGMDEHYVYLLDNNDTGHPERVGYYERVPRADFFRRWRGYGGFAWTLIHQPIPNRPDDTAPSATARHPLEKTRATAPQLCLLGLPGRRRGGHGALAA